MLMMNNIFRLLLFLIILLESYLFNIFRLNNMFIALFVREIFFVSQFHNIYWMISIYDSVRFLSNLNVLYFHNE